MNRTILLLLVVFLFETAVTAEAGPSFLRQATAGTISGRLLDPAHAVVPGGRITALCRDDGRTTEAMSDEKGRYSLTLPVGSYTVTAEVAGFRKAEHGPIALGAGERMELDIQLQSQALDHIDYVVEKQDLAELCSRSKAVVYLDILRIGPVSEWELDHGSLVKGALVWGRPIRILKAAPSDAVNGNEFAFLSYGSAVPYETGKEYVAFLQWDEGNRHYFPVRGKSYMIEISANRVFNPPDIITGIKEGMPVAALLERIRSIVDFRPKE